MGYRKTFEELLAEATMDKDDKLDLFIDDMILPAVLDKMDHRMRVLTKHQKFNGAQELFAKAMEEVSNWFSASERINKGYKFSYDEPDRHGHVTIKFTLSLFDTSRICNLSTFVCKGAIFNSTNDYLYQ